MYDINAIPVKVTDYVAATAGIENTVINITVGGLKQSYFVDMNKQITKLAEYSDNRVGLPVTTILELEGINPAEYEERYVSDLDKAYKFTSSPNARQLADSNSVTVTDGLWYCIREYIELPVYSDSSPYPIDTYEHFMYVFNNISATSKKDFTYNVDGSLDVINIRDNLNVILYTKGNTYTNGVFTASVITEIATGDKVTVTFVYSNITGAVTSSTPVFVAGI